MLAYASEHLRLLGMPVPASKTSAFSAHQLRDLSGEMFASPVIGFLEAVLLLSLHEVEMA